MKLDAGPVKLFLFVLCLGLAGPAAAQEGSAEAGGEIVTKSCAACHMPKGAPVALPGKTPPPHFRDVANAENLFEVVAATLDNPKHPMRPITLNEQQIADVTAFIRTVK